MRDLDRGARASDTRRPRRRSRVVPRGPTSTSDVARGGASARPARRPRPDGGADPGALRPGVACARPGGGALGRAGDAKSAAPLAHQLADASWWVRRNSAYALAALGEPGRDDAATDRRVVARCVRARDGDRGPGARGAATTRVEVTPAHATQFHAPRQVGPGGRASSYVRERAALEGSGAARVKQALAERGLAAAQAVRAELPRSVRTSPSASSSTARLREDDVVVEIGPGAGALTAAARPPRAPRRRGREATPGWPRCCARSWPRCRASRSSRATSSSSTWRRPRAPHGVDRARPWSATFPTTSRPRSSSGCSSSAR